MNNTETAVEAVVEPPAPPTFERPAFIPEKFWDPEQRTVRLEALAKSYGELERKLGDRRPTAPAETRAPESPPVEIQEEPKQAEGSPPGTPPAAYRIESRHALLSQDPELDSRLQQAGFSEAQAQLVYDLAAERLLPMLDEAFGEVEAQRHVERLERHFGGADAWRQTARQIKSWAAAHLANDVSAALCSSYEGVLALHQMMRASEPELLGGGQEPAADLTEDGLAEMMRDPRYWRRRDPDFVARVTAGFKKLYGV